MVTSDRSQAPDPEPPPWLVFPVLEMVAVFAILGTMTAVLLPAVEIARERKNLPPLCPWVQPAINRSDWLVICPIACTAVLTTLLLLVRHWMPPRIRRYFPWRNKKS